MESMVFPIAMRIMMQPDTRAKAAEQGRIPFMDHYVRMVSVRSLQNIVLSHAVRPYVALRSDSSTQLATMTSLILYADHLNKPKPKNGVLVRNSFAAVIEEWTAWLLRVAPLSAAATSAAVHVAVQMVKIVLEDKHGVLTSHGVVICARVQRGVLTVVYVDPHGQGGLGLRGRQRLLKGLFEDSAAVLKLTLQLTLELPRISMQTKYNNCVQWQLFLTAVLLLNPVLFDDVRPLWTAVMSGLFLPPAARAAIRVRTRGAKGLRKESGSAWRQRMAHDTILAFQLYCIVRLQRADPGASLIIKRAYRSGTYWLNNEDVAGEWGYKVNAAYPKTYRERHALHTSGTPAFTCSMYSRSALGASGYHGPFAERAMETLCASGGDCGMARSGERACMARPGRNARVKAHRMVKYFARLMPDVVGQHSGVVEDFAHEEHDIHPDDYTYLQSPKEDNPNEGMQDALDAQ
jgi:hypothetical protein